MTMKSRFFGVCQSRKLAVRGNSRADNDQSLPASLGAPYRKHWGLPGLLLVSMVMLFGIGNGIAQDDFQYQVSGGNATISGYTGPGGAVIIPGTIDEYPVTIIGYRAFQNKTAITSVVVSDSVTHIRDWAFENCTGLKDVTLGSSVTVIGSAAFRNCTGLTDVIIPDSVTSIRDWAFYACTGLASVTLGSGLTAITVGAFRECTSLTAFSVDAANTAFRSENGVLFNHDKTRIIQYPGGKAGAYSIPDSVTGIEGGAFYNCTSLTSLVIPDSLTSIGDSVFFGCGAGLTGVYFQGDAPTHGSDVFAHEFNSVIYCIPGKAGWPTVPDPWCERPTAHWSGGPSFAQWLVEQGVAGEPDEVFGQICPLRGVAYGFRYAFNDNLAPGTPLLKMLRVNGRAIIETQAQYDGTWPFVSVRLLGSADLAEWTLPIQAAQDTTGNPDGCAWHQIGGPSRDKSFVKLAAELK